MAVYRIIRGLPSSNKHKGKIGKPKVSEIAYSLPYADGTVYALKPVIDKITFTFGIDDQDKDGLSGGLWEYACAESIPEYVKATGSVFKQSRYGFSVRYKRVVSLVEPNSKQRVHIFCDPASDSARFLRFELNPALLGASGLKYVREKLNDLLGPHYSYEDIMETGRVTRVDVATDLINVYVDDLMLLSGLGGKSVLFQSENSVTETIYLHEGGTTKAGKLKPSGHYVYDKTAKEASTGGQQHKDYGDLQVSRVEIRNKPKCYLKNLGNQTIPFDAVSISLPPIISPSSLQKLGEGNHHWRWFLDSVRRTGLNNALRKIDGDVLRQTYLKEFQASNHAVWRADALGKLWSDTVASSGLLDHSQ